MTYKSFRRETGQVEALPTWGDLHDDEPNSPRSGFKGEFTATPWEECIIAAATCDSLAALIKSAALSNLQRHLIRLEFQSSAETLDAKIALVLVGDSLGSVRRKARLIKRRLIIALLVRHTDYSLGDIRGMKYKALVNLAKAKLI